jgi:hypothetical protein
MANKKTSEEADASPLAGTELIRGVQAGADVKLTPDQISTLVLSKAALAELIRDTIAAALTEVANITITPNDGSDTITIASSGGGGGGGSPGGSDTQVQFNDGGAFAGDDNLVWDKTDNKLRVGPSFGIYMQGKAATGGGVIGRADVGESLLITHAQARFAGNIQIEWMEYSVGAADITNPAVLGLKKVSNGVAQFTDGSTGLGTVIFKLPTTDPAIAGALWNSSGTITISAG